MYLGIPQIIMLALMVFNITLNIVKDGEPKDEKYSFITTLIATAISFGLLYWGGFFG